MERNENRFAFRASDEMGDFVRKMAKETGWSDSDVLRFGFGFFMMSIRNGFFATLGTSKYRSTLENINLSSRDLTPMSEVDSLIDISKKYVQANAQSHQQPEQSQQSADSGSVVVPVSAIQESPIQLPKADVKQKKKKR